MSWNVLICDLTLKLPLLTHYLPTFSLILYILSQTTLNYSVWHKWASFSFVTSMFCSLTWHSIGSLPFLLGPYFPIKTEIHFLPQENFLVHLSQNRLPQGALLSWHLSYWVVMAVPCLFPSGVSKILKGGQYASLAFVSPLPSMMQRSSLVLVE